MQKKKKVGWVLILCWLNLVCILIGVAAQNFYLLFLFFSTYEFIRTLFHRLFSTHLQAQFIHVLPSHPTAPPKKKKSPALWQGVNWLGHTACTSTRSRACEPFRPVFCACTCQREWSLRLPSGTDVGFAARKHKTRKRPERRRCCQRLLWPPGAAESHTPAL